MSKDIAVFGLSANPPTGDEGHVGIVKFLLETKRFDEVWVLPVYTHQFGKKLESYEDRINMCKLSMESLSSADCKVLVLPLEKQVNEIMGGQHGSVDTLEYIKQEHTDAILHLILGGDTFNDVAAGKWKNGERLYDLAQIHVIEREGVPVSHLSKKNLQRCVIHHVQFLGGISSTEIRCIDPYPFWPLPVENAALCRGVHPLVYNYMKSAGLYNFSPLRFNAQRRSRLACLGFIAVAFLRYQLSSAAP